MKNLLHFILAAWLVFPNTSAAQKTDPVEKEKKQIIQTIEKYGKQLYVDQNIDAVEELYPSKGISISISNHVVDEGTLESISERALDFFTKYKGVTYQLKPDPYIHISEDGNTAFVYATEVADFEIVETGKNMKFIDTGLMVLIKKNGKWKMLLETNDQLAEGDAFEVDKNVLNTYDGAYLNETTKNKITVSNDGKNIIYTTAKGNESTWIPKSENTFKLKGKSPTITFGRDKNGKISHFTVISGSYVGIRTKVQDDEAIAGVEWKKYESARSYLTGGDPSSNSEENAGYVKSVGDEPKGNGIWYSVLEADKYLGKRIKLSVNLKTENVENNAGMFMRVNGENRKILAMDNMRNDRALKATTDWKSFDMVLDVPEISQNIVCGLALEGAGQVWAKDLKLEVVDESVAVTDNYDYWIEDFYSGNYEKAIPSLERSIEGKKGRLDKYYSIYYYVALMETGQKEKANAFIADFAHAQKDDEWVSQIACFLCGDLKEKKFLKESDHENTTTDLEQKCEAYYFMGLVDKYNNNMSRAKECFEKCLATNQTNFIEYNLAQLELENL